ncbi:MAG: hypothetical protein ACE5H9_21005, partial [Anaerolineae bacterium]
MDKQGNTMPTELQEKIQWFKEDYLDTPAGQDITDDVLRSLLPHTGSEFHRQNGYRSSTWPCIQRDVRSWFEGAGWKKPEDWTPTARGRLATLESLLAGE